MDTTRKDFSADHSLKFVFLELAGLTTNVSQEVLALKGQSAELTNASLPVHVKMAKSSIPTSSNVLAQQGLDGTEKIALYVVVDKPGTTLMVVLVLMDLS